LINIKNQIFIIKRCITVSKKKTGPAKRFGTRYGRSTREKVGAIEAELRKDHKCPYCHFEKVKRVSVGIWTCAKCGAKFTGKAYKPTARKLRTEMSKQKFETAVETEEIIKEEILEEDSHEDDFEDDETSDEEIKDDSFEETDEDTEDYDSDDEESLDDSEETDEDDSFEEADEDSDDSFEEKKKIEDQ
jgi:large subunit ribosomal protein L37Ae